MADRLRELLIKAIRRLDPAEQDEVLGELLGRSRGGGGGRQGWAELLQHPLGGQIFTAGDSAGRRPSDLLPRDRMETFERLSALVGEGGDLKMLPVRLPVADYERLRNWSREHGFSMAVIIRTLVERFLDGRDGKAEQKPE
jgi:hypothetical protein